jgi:D-alanine--poly(phosphoribitol) ligase subunit 1
MSLRAATKADLEKIAQFNNTEKAFPHNATIQELIEAQVEKYSSATAVICDHDKVFGGSSMSYGELNGKANQVARLLRSNSVKPDQIIGIMVERSFAMIIGILGIIKAGAAYLPISPNLPADRIDYMLEDASAQLLLVQYNTANKIDFAGRIINLEAPETYEGSTQNPVVANKSTNLAYVIYTSGSTGKPKGVMIEHRSVVNRLSWMQNAYPIGEEDVILQKTPYSFDVSVWELFWCAFNGAKLCFLAPGGEAMPLRIVDAVRKHKVSVMHFVPSMLNVFLEYLDGKDASVVQGISVRRIFASGEALTPSHVRRFNAVLGGKTGAQLTNLYGPTEATVDVSYFDCPTHNDFEKVPIGRPIDNTRFYIVKNAEQVAIGEIGELYIGGVGLARGYLNNAHLTSEKFVKGLGNSGERVYRTGDNARWLPDGNVEYLGREDQQVKIRGLRIELGEIESTIRDFPGITDCVCVVKQYSENIILIIAYIVCRKVLKIEDLRRFLQKHLPDYMVPNYFEKIGQIPLGPSGKANRTALPEPVIQAKKSLELSQ